ncbi:MULTISPECIES: FAD-dependent oxidoreductase [unclassified Streptomyces]|uniref:NAD(P)/FAD-dependent oxidoreductase n=1 Tax=unclassified Streptomyces TaxID=2593676 RepID=UPI002DDC26EB|nr:MULTISPECIES: FAD-dependent oxidoreductase [unclassified Streptomyces]WSA90961.1 FAD-dependent oxidoreductase [Streptomyces sp. NBC_01795]WSB75286.1 FAD-dependent oxidoreductase [Streptomyces sp. NBC_01775]WSS16431.1 FAD-dependent oxidoreductase [Streptomyces sp. NBC_01186]WSS45249.1 FAD-dependent oxidoreductase [Streptomyces sp. NBC_01187]
MRTITVIGASLAGLYAAMSLRSQGYDGRLVIVGEEHHRPYDRPPLSKEFLTGALTAERLALADAEEIGELDADWLLGTRAEGLDPPERTVLLSDGRRLSADGVVLATGAVPRTLPGEPLDGVHTLRTLDDAAALREELSRGQVRVVVIGAGFIGAEVASSCATLGHHVTVVEAAEQPLLPQLGDRMAAFCADLHTDHGVTLLTGTGVRGLHGDGQGRVAWVELADGRHLPADVVVVGIGVRPATGWLEGSGIPLDDGVVCDAGGMTSVPGVVAVGDVARSAGRRAEHWTSAMEQPAVAARNLLAGSTVETYTALPYFWSDQYGIRLQLAGHREPDDTVRLVEGAPEDRSFLAVYERDGVTTAVLAANRPRPFMRLRRELSRTGGLATV